MDIAECEVTLNSISQPQDRHSYDRHCTIPLTVKCNIYILKLFITYTFISTSYINFDFNEFVSKYEMYILLEKIHTLIKIN